MLAGVKRGLHGLLALAVLAGCSSDDSESDPPPAKGAPREVAQVIERLEEATRQRDFAAICKELLTQEARERAGGGDCIRLLRSTAADVRRPRISVLSIQIEGDRADVRVRSTAEGQGSVQETIRLVREGDGYRIAALDG
jgi:hypothetical protein